ncbi:MAG: PDC sensor domain-containing protein [Gammaproteobacteria bacterium]|nr:PDC sensor domain-containing protein [Gammaproteobacteria bacterium]
MNREHWYSKMTSGLTNPDNDNGQQHSPNDNGGDTNYSSQLESSLEKIAQTCAHVWNNRSQLDVQLTKAIKKIEQCCYIYAINSQGIQVSSSISCDSTRSDDEIARDRRQRPYIRQLSPGVNFLLSRAYISQTSGKLAATALHTVHSSKGALLGYVGIEFRIEQLLHSSTIYDEPSHWKQLKGDPAIRGTLFSQKRIDSAMDKDIDTVLPQIETLMKYHGVFQVNLHFSSSRSTVWFTESPHKYRLLDTEMLTKPDLSLTYPIHQYPDDAKIRESEISDIIRTFHELRLSDDVIYLRSASINIFNGLISLTFSCDGTHYLPHSDLLNRNHKFWNSETNYCEQNS